MAGEIIKVYNTEDSAKEGGTAGQVAVGTIAGNGGAIYNSTLTVPYFVYKEYWYRIELNNIASGVYIDWDDGEDNSAERANFQFVPITQSSISPRVAIASHIYTTHGSFFPLIKAVSLDGFESKWYTNDANPGYKKLSNLTLETGAVSTPAGINNFSIVREEKAETDKIPHFLPAGRPPIAILKADRKRVYAGIDNEFISGTSPLLYAYTDSSKDAADLPDVTMEAAGGESRQVREYASIEVQKTSMLSSINLTNDVVPTGSSFTASIQEVTDIVCAADTVDNAAGADLGYSNPSGNNGKFIMYTSSDASTKFTVSASHPVVAQVVTIEFTSDVVAQYGLTDGVNDHYMSFSSAIDSDVYHWWLDITGSDDVPSAISLGKNEGVNISGAANAEAIAVLVAAAIDGGMPSGAGSSIEDEFSAVAVGPQVIVTWSTAGETASPGRAITGARLNIASTVFGEDAGVAVTGGTVIEANIASGDSDTAVATAVATAIDANANFDAKATGATVRITHTIAADVRDTDSVTSPFSGLSKITNGIAQVGNINNVHKLYKAKLDNVDALENSDRIYIMVHDFDGTTGTATPTPDTDICVGILSNGNPIIQLDDAYSTTTIDASESYARAANLRIKEYSFDLDKQTVSGVLHNDLVSIPHTDTTDSADTGNVTNMTRMFGKTGTGTTTSLNYGNLSRIKQSYTFDTLGNPFDSNGVFYDMRRLVRLQVEDTSLDSHADPSVKNYGGDNSYGAQVGDINRFSIIDDWDTGASDRDSGETVYLTMAKAGSFTKDATITQTTSGATGKVLRSTKNNKFVEVYDVTGTFTTTGGHSLTSSNPDDYDTEDYGDHSLLPSATDVGTLRILKEEILTGRKTLMVGNGSGRTNNTANNRTSAGTVNNGGIIAADAATFTAAAGHTLATNDYIAFATDAEMCKVTNVSTNVITIDRAEFGTVATTHANSVVIYEIRANYQATTNFDNDSILLGGDSTFELVTTTNITDHPENFIITSIPQKYDKLYFRLANTLTNNATEPEMNISIYYTKKTVNSNVASYTWEPLPIIDGTQQFTQSGVIRWDVPEDWASVIYSDLTWDIVGDDSASAFDANSKWTKDGYGIAVMINVKTPTVDTNAHEEVKLYNVWPIIDEHSQLITIEDPHHVSLNDISISNSISYSRKGKYMTVENRLGKSDIRRIGAAGGSVSFGGLDLGTTTGRDKIVDYQKNGIPVFLDVVHKDTDKTRFFGKIVSVNETFPTGTATPTYSLEMQVAHVIELNSTGVMQSDKISLGGITEDAKYLL